MPCTCLNGKEHIIFLKALYVITAHQRGSRALTYIVTRMCAAELIVNFALTFVVILEFDMD